MVNSTSESVPAGHFRLWDACAQKPVSELLEGRVDHAFHEGSYLAILSSTGLLFLWSLTDGKLLAEPVKHEDLSNVAVSPDGAYFLTYNGTATASRSFADQKDELPPSIPDDTRPEPVLNLWAVSSGKANRQHAIREKGIMSLAISQNAGLVTIRSRGKDVKTEFLKLLDFRTSQLLCEPILHPGSILEVSISPDSRHVLTACDDGYVRIWERQGRLALCQPFRVTEGLYCQWAPDAKRVFIASKSGLTFIEIGNSNALWNPIRFSGALADTSSYIPLSRQFEALTSQSMSRLLYFDTTGNSIVWAPWGDRNGPTFELDARPGSALPRVVALPSKTGCVSLTPDGKRLAISGFMEIGAGGSLHLWDVASGLELYGLTNVLGNPVFSQDNSMLLLTGADADGITTVYSAPTGKPIESLAHRFDKAGFLDGGNTVVGLSRKSPALTIWHFPSDKSAGPQMPFSGTCMAMGMSADAETCAIIYGDQRIEILCDASARSRTPLGSNTLYCYDVRTSVPLVEMPLPLYCLTNRAHAPMIIPHGHGIAPRDVRIAFGSGGITAPGQTTPEGTARLQVTQKRAPMPPAIRNTLTKETVNSAYQGAQLEFSRDKSRLLILSKEALLLVDIIAKAITPLVRGSCSARFTSTGLRIIVQTDTVVRNFDVHTGKEMSVPLYKPEIILLEISPKDDRIAVAAADSSVHVWDAKAGESVAEFTTANLTSLQFGPSGKRLFTVTKGGTVRIWDVDSGLPISEKFVHESDIKSIHVAPDESRMVTVTEKRIVVWDIKNPEMPVEPWFIDLATAIGGKRLADNLSVIEVPLSSLNDIRNRISSGGNANGWKQWVHWFLADRGTRGLSPFSGGARDK